MAETEREALFVLGPARLAEIRHEVVNTFPGARGLHDAVVLAWKEAMDEAFHEWTAPSGVKVRSTAPQHVDNWWDKPHLHPIWSWTSWISMILVDYNHPAMRKFFKRRGWW